MAPLLAVKMDRIIPGFHSLEISPFNLPIFHFSALPRWDRYDRRALLLSGVGQV
jgi:hypothetical protein